MAATFEQSLARLEEITAKLERGDAPLEESVKLYEEGSALAVECEKILADARQHVALLATNADGVVEETPFAVESQ
ncbi:MAG: exodeoxyribonuclease VII small subunit [Oscillospiraceae bacterium]|nr:exodeoxyribonuclease VII small subunit [Oscillospiraceae bacterium]